jgi:hypothetical protein
MEGDALGVSVPGDVSGARPRRAARVVAAFRAWYSSGEQMKVRDAFAHASQYEKGDTMSTNRALWLAILVTALVWLPRAAGAQHVDKKDCMFMSSLHFTAGGMGYWYDAKNGGLETVTGVPYSELGCKNCHVASCDDCHKTEVAGKAVYSTKVAKDQALCLKCHAREASMMKVDKAQNHEDVHVLAGMQCMDCHTGSDVHGDGTQHASMKQVGVVSAKCETCHEKISQTVSHTVHGGKLDCNACHVRQVVSCTNCHFETLVKTGKRVAVPVSGWVFLMNANGKVTSANMQTFVAPENKTFLMFAPQFSHSVMKKGRSCEECHGTAAVAEARSKNVRLLWNENGEVKHAVGVIPVAVDARYGLVFQNFQDGKWTIIENPAEPPVHFAGYGEPLSQSQVEKLAKPQHTK